MKRNGNRNPFFFMIPVEINTAHSTHILKTKATSDVDESVSTLTLPRKFQRLSP